jgi:hypothetical protein
MKRIKTKIIRGGVRVNEAAGAVIERSSPDIKCVYIDLHTKYAEVVAVGGGASGPSVLLGATKRSLHCARGKKRDEWTEIKFPDLDENWDVFATDIGRYSLSVCLIRRKGYRSTQRKKRTKA